MWRWLALLGALAACTSSSPGSNDAAIEAPANRNFRCEGTWVCSGAGDAGVVSSNLTIQNGQCILAGFSPDTILRLDGALLRNGQIVGHVTGSGDTVDITLDMTKYGCRGATDSTRDCSRSCGM